jgi:hypothetical protein
MCEEGDIAAFEVFDAFGNKVFDTNEDTPCDLQEANAALAVAAPQLRDALVECLRLLAGFDSGEGEEAIAYKLGQEALLLCNPFGKGSNYE